MWTCPKCGREFKKTNQDHYCGKAPETVDEYLALQTPQAQKYFSDFVTAVFGQASTGLVQVCGSIFIMVVSGSYALWLGKKV